MILLLLNKKCKLSFNVEEANKLRFDLSVK